MSQTVLDSCPICEWGPAWGPESAGTEERDGPLRRIRCRRCGTFEIHTADAPLELTPEQRVAASAFIKKRALRGEPLRPLALAGSRPEGATAIEDIEAVTPRTLTDVQNEILLTLAAMRGDRGEPGYGSRLVLFSAEHGGQLSAPIAFTFDTQRLLFHLDQLLEEGLLEWSERPVGIDSLRTAAVQIGLSGVALSLTRQGWLRHEALVRGIAENPDQAFVAMWFDASMEAAYHQGIAPAIADAGYTAVQLAFVEHNDDIDDRIIAEIRKSRFIIADFTGGRGGVYFEAGFALGAGKPVIFTCRRDWFDQEGVHFDTEHRNHILWSDATELRQKLRARIEATVPRV